MGREVELKLELPRAILRSGADLPEFRDLASGPPVRAKLASVYFDTRKLKLRKRGVALRIRNDGRRRVQTIKATQPGRSAPLGRDEWEQVVAGAMPDLSLTKGTALAPLVGHGLRRKLRPVFETVVERTTLPVRIGTSDIEVAFDRGWIKAGRRRERINEIELELKNGDPADLAEIADRLARSLPVAYASRSKQDRGYALAGGERSGAVGAAGVPLASDISTGDAFPAVALACLDQLLANARAVDAGDAEGVHQMRVGLRRLRAALSLFKPLVDGAGADAIKAELEWLSGQLAPARDFDVLVAEGVRPLREAAPAAETRLLTKRLQGKRDRGLDRAKAVVAGERFRVLGLNTALWILRHGWRPDGDDMTRALSARPAVEFAAETLAKRLGKIVEKAGRIESLDSRGRHKLRIAVKKLRYATEFFGGLFGHEHRRERFARHLKALQKDLGRLNDIDVHKHVADGIVHRERTPRRADAALAMGFILGHEHTTIGPHIAAVAKSARRLADASPFWCRAKP